MTRPGGLTPRGLPYPGSANIHAETPKALQALADAVTAQLGYVSGGIALRFWTGLVQLDGNAAANLTATFPGLTIAGGLVQLTTHAGGSGKIGFCTAVGVGGQFSVSHVYGWVLSTGPDSFKNVQVGICAVVWGTG